MQRHTRAHVREQRSRWIWKRIRQARGMWGSYPDEGEFLTNYYRPFGVFSKRDPFDCGRTRCGICHAGGNDRREGRERLVVKSELESLNQ